MTDPFIRLALLGALVPITLFAWIVIGLLRGRGVNPLRGVAKLLPRSMVECLLLVSSVLGFLKVGGSKGTNGLRGVSAPAPAPLFSSASVTTNGTWDFSAPPGATVHERWRRRGAADDWFPLFPAGWSFALGDTSVTNIRVFSRGKSRLPDGTEISPLPATLGVVPEVNWQLLGSNSPSLFWHSLSSDGSLLLTWQNVLLHRAATNPVSVQAELRPSGGVTFRYDLSRLSSDDPLSDVVPAADVVSPDAPLSRGVTGVSFKSRDEALCDAARAAFEESLVGLAPLSFPEGSTNTVLEHLFYSGTTNGAFFYPLTNDSTAVLRVAVTGSGSGDLLVGGSYVPLVAPPQMRGGTPQGNPLMFPVPKGGTVPVYLRGDGTLSVSFDSGEFAFGELPSLSANRCVGWINFPETRATEPCVHDLRTRRRTVSLPASSGADDLVCTWNGAANVGVENIPPRSARITASFDARETRGITYALSHPKRLFGQTDYAQTVRFCPRPPDPDPDDPEPEPPWYSGDDHDEEDEEEEDPQGLPEDPEPGEPGDGDADEECPVHDVPYEQCAHLHEDDYTNAVQNVAHMAGVLYVRDPPVVGDQVYLEVPNGHVNCCGCPDHWTNYVGIAYQSHRLRVTDQGGSPFGISGMSCMVDVAGVAPSEAVGDAELAFARDGEIYKRRGYTVLGVGIRRDGVPLSRYNELSPSLGFPMAVCTNQWNAPELRLVTNVGLPTGGVRLELEDAMGQFAVWCRDGDGWRKLVDCDSPVADFPMHGWRAVMRGAGCRDSPELPVRLTSSSPGSARLVFRYWNVVAGAFVEDSASQRITSLNPPLLPDLNYDGNIDNADLALYLAGRWFRFWTNEDTAKGDYVGQSDNVEPNASDLVVNGAYDLVNFFPLGADFSALRSAWGNNVTYRLEPESGDSGALNFLWANVGRAGYRRMQTETVRDLGGNALSGASLTALPSVGCEIPGSVLGALSGTDGMLVAEAVSNLATLRFVVRDGDDEIFSCGVPLSIYTVRDMYRWLNIRYAAGGTGGEQSRLGEPWNRPDEVCDGRHFVFVHGYNVNPDAARQWADAIFKRLWWSGSKSMFTAVDWYGDDSQFATLAHGDVSPDYYANVMHAFASAPALASQVAALPGTNTVLLAHSLGNMLVSSAIKDCGLSGYSKYYMLNAAVPMEAYDEAAAEIAMIDSEWSAVPPQYRASDWWGLFPTNDFRFSLSWRGRFAGIQNAVNCYSESENVLGNPSVGQLTFTGGEWKIQELAKGTTTWHALNAIPFLGLNVACEGGWGINTYYAFDPTWYIYQYGFTDKVQTNMTSRLAKEHPLFTPFRAEAESMHSTNLFVIADADYRSQLRAKFLADAIPATSFAAGANPIQNDAVSGNINYETCKTTSWPRPERKWWHSDIKNVAYFFTWQLFHRIKDNDGGDTNEPQ